MKKYRMKINCFKQNLNQLKLNFKSLSGNMKKRKSLNLNSKMKYKPIKKH